MLESLNTGRSRNRKRSQNQYKKFTTKFIEGIEKEKKKSQRLQSNDKLTSIIGHIIIDNMNNSNNSILSENVTDIKKVPTTKSNTNKYPSSKSINSQEKEDSQKENIKISSKKTTIISNNPFEVCNLKLYKDISYIFNGKAVKKSEEELYLDSQYNTIDYYIKSISDKKKTYKPENQDNISSSNIFFNNNKNSVKSEEKNTKVNLQNLMESDPQGTKINSPCLILSDKINDNDEENKLNSLIKIMEDYKDIILERILCKNFQDRLILNIFISLSQTSFKLFNSMENSRKMNNFRKYIYSLSNRVQYNLLNNPNFSLTSINQKFIDILEIKNKTKINEEEKKLSNNSLKLEDENDSGLNSSSFNKNTNSNYSSVSDNNGIKENDKWFYDDEEEEIIYEHFQDFHIEDKEFNYINCNFAYEMDKDKNALSNSRRLNRNSINEENISPRIPRNKLRRNATNKIFNHKSINKSANSKINSKCNKYDFQVININGKNDFNISEDEEDSSSSFDSEEGCYELHETHKYDIPKLIFYEDHLRDKEKRKINKNNHIEIRADSDCIKDKLRLKELGDISMANIITIIDKDPKFLPSHGLNLNPFEIRNYIEDKEKKELEKIIINNYIKNEKEKENIKKMEENKNEENNNNSFLSNSYSKSDSFFQDENNKRESKILIFGKEYE